VSASVFSSMAGSYAAYAAAAVDLDPAGRLRAWDGLHLAAHPGLFAFVGQVHDDAGECGSVGGADLAARAAIVPGGGTAGCRPGHAAPGGARGIARPGPCAGGPAGGNDRGERVGGRPRKPADPVPGADAAAAGPVRRGPDRARTDPRRPPAHRAGAWPETVAALLFAESLATTVSRDLVPGLGDARYLWFADGHQPWLDACTAAYPTVAAELVGVLESTDPAVGRRFFAAGAGHSGTLPVRAGYYAGLRLVAEMRATVDDIALAGSDLARITASLRARLSSRGRPEDR